ncbi:hypothetical protein PTQ33_01670 [Campylobacter sp. 50012-21]|uniref:hypothetical protein n=1 Tax=Campylobacter magnus TaxID=3026462 RepID=UPI00235E0071|nr:hypothetical protein [Campylobacter magnus]MDD0845827.1 hypothetical protein [Campylobacter magnus]
MLLHKWENVLIFLFFIPPLFVLFIVVFPCLWSLVFYFVKFLEIKNIYKILIIFSILTLILFSAYYAYYFTEIGWLFGPLFAAGLVALPFYLWMWYKIEKEEKDNALIQRMPTLQDYFNKNKKRFITNKKMFFIGLFSVFISIWQIEVPQTILMNIMIKTSQVPEIVIFDNNYTVEVDESKINWFGEMKSNFFAPPSDEFGRCMDKIYLCPLLPFKRHFKNIYVYESIKANEQNDFSKRKKIGEIYGLYYSKPLLAILPIFGHLPSHYRAYYLKSGSSTKLNEEFELLLKTLKKHQKGEKQ